MTNSASNTVWVWGHARCLPDVRQRVFIWDDFPEQDQFVSLPQVIHEDPNRWKSEYARWLRDVGNSYVRNKYARKFEREHSGLTYWWMTLPTEFSFTKTSVGYTAMRTMALCDLLDGERPDRVVFGCLPVGVQGVLEGWARDRGVILELDSSSVCKSSSTIEHGETQPFAGLRYILSSLKHYGPRARRSTGAGLVIFDYLIERVDGKEPYSSRFWGPLVSVLNDSGPTIWFHRCVRGTSTSETKALRSFTRQVSAEERQHFLIEDALTPRVLVRALLSFHRIRKIGRRAWALVSFTDQVRRIDLRSIVAEAWYKDHLGLRAGVNALDLHLMESAVSGLDGPALYLMENQPWEVALLHAWKKQHRKSISGFVHSRAREWDCRYLLPRYGPIGSVPVWEPKPDQCLVGSSLESQIMQVNGYAGHAIHEVEALRFLAIGHPSPGSTSVPESVRVLVLGEYDDDSTAQLTNLLRMSDFSGFQVAFRPHPSRKESRPVLPSGASLSLEPSLSSALRHCDVVIAYSTSTGVYSAMQVGKPVIVIEDGAVLNGLDLRSPSIFRVSRGTPISPKTIAARIRAGIANADASRSQHLDSKLHRWRTWLEQTARRPR